MKTKKFAFLFPILMSAASANAATMGTGPIYATTTNDVNCSVFNSGSKPKTIKSLRIFRGDGSLALSVSCTALAPGSTCIANHPVNQTGLHACRLVVEGNSVSGLRGLLHRRSGADIVQSEPLR